MLVKSDVAVKQLEGDQAAQQSRTGTATGPSTAIGGATQAGGSSQTGKGSATTASGPAPQPHRFHGSVSLDATRLSRDAGKIAEEVVQHLAGLVGAHVEVSLEIHAEVSEGVPENTVRTISENCRALKFKTHGFEEK